MHSKQHNPKLIGDFRVCKRENESYVLGRTCDACFTQRHFYSQAYTAQPSISLYYTHYDRFLILQIRKDNLYISILSVVLNIEIFYSDVQLCFYIPAPVLTFLIAINHQLFSLNGLLNTISLSNDVMLSILNSIFRNSTLIFADVAPYVCTVEQMA